MPSEPSKMSPDAQNTNTRSDAPGTVENESGRAKQELEKRRPRYHRKRVRERKT
jgi:hypothetical protein